MRFLSALAASSSRWNRALRVAGNRLVDPLDPFGRVEPPIAQLDQPLTARGRSLFAELAYSGSLAMSD